MPSTNDRKAKLKAAVEAYKKAHAAAWEAYKKLKEVKRELKEK